MKRTIQWPMAHCISNTIKLDGMHYHAQNLSFKQKASNANMPSVFTSFLLLNSVSFVNESNYIAIILKALLYYTQWNAHGMGHKQTNTPLIINCWSGTLFACTKGIASFQLKLPRIQNEPNETVAFLILSFFSLVEKPKFTEFQKKKQNNNS